MASCLRLSGFGWQVIGHSCHWHFESSTTAILSRPGVSRRSRDERPLSLFWVTGPELLWPRGLTKEKASVDLWLKDIAPSTALRKWFGHDPDKREAFKERYLAELKNHSEPIRLLKQELDKGVVTLVYGAKDEEHNEAVVIQENSALFS